MTQRDGGGKTLDSEIGYAAFTTTGTTSDIVSKLSKILRYDLQPVAGTAGTAGLTYAAETLYVMEDLDTDLTGISLTSVNGTAAVTIARQVQFAGTVNSGLNFWYHFEGKS